MQEVLRERRPPVVIRTDAAVPLIALRSLLTTAKLVIISPATKNNRRNFSMFNNSDLAYIKVVLLNFISYYT